MTTASDRTGAVATGAYLVTVHRRSSGGPDGSVMTGGMRSAWVPPPPSDVHGAALCCRSTLSTADLLSGRGLVLKRRYQSILF